MKKLFLMCFLIVFIANSNAQKTKAEKAKAKTEKAAKEKTEKAAKEKKGKAEKKAKKEEKEAKEKVSTEKAPRTPDKASGEYNGKKVYTGPRGGRYYINSNGNKTYISDDK